MSSIIFCLTGFTIHQIFLLAHDWSKHITWLNIPQLKLGNIRWYSPNACCKKYLKDNKHNSLHLALKICLDICPWTLSFPWSSQFSSSFTLRKLFSSRRLISSHAFVGPLRPLMFGNSYIYFSTKSTCLGVEIDYKLNWKPQVKTLHAKFGGKLTFLKKFKALPSSVLEEIYFKGLSQASLTASLSGDLVHHLHLIFWNTYI